MESYCVLYSVLLQIAKLRVETIAQIKERKCKVKTSVNTSRSSLIRCCTRTNTLEQNFPSLDVLVDELENILKACTAVLSSDLASNNSSAKLHIQSRKLSCDLINMIHMIYVLYTSTCNNRSNISTCSTYFRLYIILHL